MEGGGHKGWTLEGVSVQGTAKIGLLTFTVRSRARTARLGQHQRDGQTVRQRDGAGVPRHAQPLASRGTLGIRDRQWRLRTSHPETGSWTCGLPASHLQDKEGQAQAAPHQQLGHYGFEEMSSQSGQEGMGS